MTILDIFKRKKIARASAKKKKKVKVKQKKNSPRAISQGAKSTKRSSRLSRKEKGEGKKTGDLTPSVKRKGFFAAYRFLKSPHITEKATTLSEANQYIFKVWPRANKTEIKKSVESIYKVNAVAVKIINVSSKKRRLGRTEGVRKGYKKAIVKIKEGQKIEILPR